jgi:hypothetical protein
VLDSIISLFQDHQIPPGMTNHMLGKGLEVRRCCHNILNLNISSPVAVDLVQIWSGKAKYSPHPEDCQQVYFTTSKVVKVVLTL